MTGDGRADVLIGGTVPFELHRRALRFFEASEDGNFVLRTGVANPFAGVEVGEYVVVLWGT